MATNLIIPTEIDLVAFISKGAHDLKSPFNRVLGFLKLVINGLDGPISEEAQLDLNTAYQNSQYALMMMSGLVEMARLKGGERELLIEDFDLDQLVAQVVSDWKRHSPKESLVELVASAPPVILPGDEILFRQGLENWISFVVEFVQEEIQVDIQVEEGPDTCQFTIRSQGKKLRPPLECDLTLYGYVARKIIELHQGVMQRAEENEQGALVQFTLPKATSLSN